jgi:sugar phosphate isomerase/epimerase
MTFPVALASYSFHGLHESGDLNLLAYLELLYARYHVANADIWTGLLPPAALETDYLKKIRRFMDDRQLTLANLCVDGPVLWVDDPDKREVNRRTMLRYIEAASILGARTIRIDFGGHDGPMGDEPLEVITDLYREYCGICHRLGMIIGPENHWGWDRLPENLARVREAVNHPAYGHLLHIGNWPEGQGEQMLETVLPILMHTHFPADSITWVKPLLRRIAQTGYQGAYSVEHHSARHELARVQWQLGILRGHIAELEQEGLENPAEESFFAKIIRQPAPEIM